MEKGKVTVSRRENCIFKQGGWGRRLPQDTDQRAGRRSSLPYRAVLKEGMIGVRGRKQPLLSMDVSPTWKPNTWRRKRRNVKSAPAHR